MFFRDTVEYDYYLRPVLNLGRCHFKGKGGGESTTERSIPEQTAEEKALQDRLMDYSSKAQDLSRGALDVVGQAHGNVFNPNWSDLYNTFSDSNDSNMSRYTDAVDSALDAFGSQVGAYKSGMDSALGRYKGDIMSALDKYTGNEGRYLGQYTGNEGKYLGQYEKALGDARASYEAEQGKRSPLWDDLVNGVLPSAFADNRQAALNADLKGTMGNAVNNYANSGVLNSSVTNKALGDISQNAADTLHKAYQSDLALEASLLNQDKANAREAYDVAAGNAGNIYGAQTGSNKNVYGAQTGSNANVFGNESNVAGNIYGNTASNLGSVMGAQTQLANSRLGSASDWIQNALNTNKANISGAITSQGASYEPISNYLNYASQLYTPGENLFNTMYGGRMGTGSTTTRTDNGNAGMWSAAGTLGAAAAIMCFVGDTLVTTPEGYKYIRDIVPGDMVLSVHDGEVVPKMVRKVSGPCEKEVIDVVFENGQVWHTTRGQRYFGGGHFHFAEGGTKLAEVYEGEPTKVLEVVYSGRTDKVYDVALEGFKGENVFFANDVAAEGFGE